MTLDYVNTTFHWWHPFNVVPIPLEQIIMFVMFLLINFWKFLNFCIFIIVFLTKRYDTFINSIQVINASNNTECHNSKTNSCTLFNSCFIAYCSTLSLLCQYLVFSSRVFSMYGFIVRKLVLCLASIS